MKLKFLMAALGLLAATFTSCSSTEAKDNELTAEEQQQGWKLLFDGKSTKGWHLYNQGQIASAWVAKNGELTCSPEIDAERGDLVTDMKYENFVLTFDWKIGKNGNSGVFINVLERADIPRAWASGPEYQLLEESHHDFANDMKRSGCLYGLSAQVNPVKLKPIDQWNQSIIKQQDGKVEFYLNGKLTAKQDFTTQEWKDAVAKTNFKNYPEFGQYTSGHIALQDWNEGISFKNIKIKML